jgi:hypothetical protein
MNDGILDRQNYRISPYGNLQNITWEGSNRTAVRLVFDNVVLGEVGYTVSVTIENVTALDGSPMMKGEGNTATFSGFSEDLSGIYTYPSPVNISQQNTVEGMYFAKLPQKATIRIMTLSGRHIQQIEETDGNGGVEWNLRDAQGKPIYPGVYLYQVTTPEGTSMIGKFTVVGE